MNRLEPFKANNVFAESYRGNSYVVYSYGYHWPMYVFTAGQWFANQDRYSVTTSKQMSQARYGFDYTAELKCLPVSQMRYLADTLRDLTQEVA